MRARSGRLRRATGAAFVAAALGGRGARAQAPDPGAPVASAERPGIERLGAVVQQRLQLTGEQTARLRETSQRYAAQRRALLRDERDARRVVREEVARGGAADQARVQGALDRLYQIQQRRSDLAASEQRDLATFLTPTQRAQYAGMQERAFRTAQAIRQRHDAGAAGPVAAGPPAVGPAAPDSAQQRRAPQDQPRQPEPQSSPANSQDQKAAHPAARRAEREARRGAAHAPQPDSHAPR